MACYQAAVQPLQPVLPGLGLGPGWAVPVQTLCLLGTTEQEELEEMHTCAASCLHYILDSLRHKLAVLGLSSLICLPRGSVAEVSGRDQSGHQEPSVVSSCGQLLSLASALAQTVPQESKGSEGLLAMRLADRLVLLQSLFQEAHGTAGSGAPQSTNNACTPQPPGCS